MQPECHSLWLLLSVCTYHVYMTLLCYEISLMHWPLHIMCLVCARSFIEIDYDGTSYVIGVQYTTPRPWHVLIPWSPDHVISPLSHLVILVFYIPIIIPMQDLLPIHRYSCWNLHIHFYSIFALVLSSKPRRKAQKYLGKYSLSNWPKYTPNSI
jgi:hypothetical protein